MNRVISPEDALSRAENAAIQIAQEKATIAAARKVEAEKEINQVLDGINKSIRGACAKGETYTTIALDGVYRDLHKAMAVKHLQDMGYRTRIWEANDSLEIQWGRSLDKPKEVDR